MRCDPGYFIQVVTSSTVLFVIHCARLIARRSQIGRRRPVTGLGKGLVNVAVQASVLSLLGVVTSQSLCEGKGRCCTADPVLATDDVNLSVAN